MLILHKKYAAVILALLFLFNNEVNGQDSTIAAHYMDLSLFELSQIKVVSAGKKEERIEEIPASVQIITRADIERYGYLDVKEILESIPGFYITDDRSIQGANINVRGFWSPEASHVYITVNGVSQIFDSFDHFPLNEIGMPVEAIDRIEIVRGPMSVIYGSGAFFGSINIVTNETKEDQSYSHVGIKYAFDGHANNTFISRTQKQNLSFSINAAYDNQYWENLAYDDLMNNPDNIGLEGRKTGTKPLESSGKYFNLNGKYNSFYSSLSFSETNKGCFAYFAPVPDNKLAREVNNLRFGFGYKKQIGEKLTLDAKYEYGNVNAESNDWVLYQSHVYGYLYEDMRYKQFDFLGFYRPNQKIDITLGALYRDNVKNLATQDNVAVPNAVNSRFRLQPESVRNKYALYTEVDIQVIERLRLTAGVRLEQQYAYHIFKSYRLGMDTLAVNINSTVPRNKANLIPRFAAIYNLNKKHVLKIMVGKAIKQPSIVNNLDILNYNHILSENKAFLLDEEIFTTELNYMAFLNKNNIINASVFRNSMNNLIQRNVEIVPGTNTWIAYTDNTGKLLTHGVEFIFNTTPTKHIQADISFSYQQTKDLDRPDQAVAFSPNLLGYAKIAYDIPLSLTKVKGTHLSIALSTNYTDKMYSYWNTQTTDSGDPNAPEIGRIGDETPAFFVVNSNLRLNNFLTTDLWLGIKVYNLLDSKIYSPTYTSNAWADKGMLGQSQHFLLMVGYKF